MHLLVKLTEFSIKGGWESEEFELRQGGVWQ